MSVQAWDQILQKGENILWQGRPHNGMSLGPQEIFMTIFGLFFAGFAAFWMLLASQGGGGFWMFGLLHFSAGVGLIIYGLFGAKIRRSHTWYTLTNRRGFIATDLPLRARTLKSYPINADTALSFEGGHRQSIFFASEKQRTKRGYRDQPVGFELLDDQDATTVQAHMRKIQQGDT